MSEDNLDQFIGIATCPVCGCLERKGAYRCPECGTFHAGSIMEEREAPPPMQINDVDKPDLDPRNYSLGPNQASPEESFEQSEDVKAWDGGSSDFMFEDDDEPINVESKITEFPEPENLGDED
jgi:hypothetical protein